MNHDELVQVAKKWLVGTAGCAFAVGEIMSCNGEIPDAIGFKSDSSILVECKTSRSDFLADKKKPFRIKPEKGMGDHRYFLCPPDVIKQTDDLNGWGLLWISKGRVRQIVNPIKEVYTPYSTRPENQTKKVTSYQWHKRQHVKNREAEHRLLISLTRRMAQKCPYLEKNIKVK